MLGNFTYCNPTKLYFGKDALENLHGELQKYGKKIVLVYGGGSIKKNGIYDDVVNNLHDEGKAVAEIAGVMVRECIDIARKHGVDLILAVGGGSVIDYAKALAVSVHCDEDPWDKYFIRFEEPSCDIVPVSDVLTMVGTGSEMNIIAAVIVGVTSMMGGVGTIVGTVIGSVLMAMITNVLIMLGVSAYWQAFVFGFILIVSLFIDRYRQRSLNA